MNSTSSSSSTSTGLDAIKVSFLQSNAKNGGHKPLPLVVSPRWNSSKRFLINWCRANQSWLDEMLLTYGAVLIRGFELETAADLEEAIRSYHSNLNNTYRGTSPRKLIAGTDSLYSAAEVPVNYPIAQHLEMSFLDAPPRQLFFGCLRQSNGLGGETALADFRKVCLDLDPQLKLKLLEKRIFYKRTHHKVGSYFTYDVSAMLGWPELFGTSDKEQVDKICAQEGIPVEWHGDTFVSKTCQDAFQLHPETGEQVWFNHTQVFHWTTFPAELWFAFTRTHDVRLFLHFMLVALFCVVKYGILGYEMGLHATFGDGTLISVKEMREIRRCIHSNMVFNRWQTSDLLLLDNFSTSHGRQPTYDKGRKLVVAWADPLLKSNLVKSVETFTVAAAVVDVAACMENPQERTPESTLTRSESQVLKGTLNKHHHLSSLDPAFGAMENPQEQRAPKKKRKPTSSFVADANFWEAME